MPSGTESSVYLETLRSSSTTDSEARAALRSLRSVARSGLEFETACTILESALCHPVKDVFGDAVYGSFPLDEAAASQYVLRAVSTLELLLATVQSLAHVPLPEAPRPSNIDAPIIEELSSQEAQREVDVSSIILCCLLHISCPKHADHILDPATPWANDSTTKRAHDVLLALSHRSVGDAQRDAQAPEGDKILEMMLQQVCIPCMKQTMASITKKSRPEEYAEDHMHEGPDAFQRCTAAYQALQYAMQLHHPVASECVTPLLPVITAALADPIPFVKRCAAAALSHLARQTTAAALYAHASILKSCVARAFIGCEGLAWESLLQAGCGVATRLDSVNGGSEYKLDVLTCTLEEVKRSDTADLWRPWLCCLAGDGQVSRHGLLHGIGLEVLSCTSKLMPMLLDRLILANTDETRLICQVCTFELVIAPRRGLPCRQAELMGRCMCNSQVALIDQKALQVLRMLRTSAPQRMRAHADVLLLGLRCVKQRLSALFQDDVITAVIDVVEKTEEMFEAEE